MQCFAIKLNYCETNSVSSFSFCDQQLVSVSDGERRQLGVFQQPWPGGDAPALLLRLQRRPVDRRHRHRQLWSQHRYKKKKMCYWSQKIFSIDPSEHILLLFFV